jgi:hypothetical protein
MSDAAAQTSSFEVERRPSSCEKGAGIYSTSSRQSWLKDIKIQSILTHCYVQATEVDTTHHPDARWSTLRLRRARSPSGNSLACGLISSSGAGRRSSFGFRLGMTTDVPRHTLIKQCHASANPERIENQFSLGSLRLYWKGIRIQTQVFWRAIPGSCLVTDRSLSDRHSRLQTTSMANLRA